MHIVCWLVNCKETVWPHIMYYFYDIYIYVYTYMHIYTCIYTAPYVLFLCILCVISMIKSVEHNSLGESYKSVFWENQYWPQFRTECHAVPISHSWHITFDIGDTFFHICDTFFMHYCSTFVTYFHECRIIHGRLSSFHDIFRAPS